MLPCLTTLGAREARDTFRVPSTASQRTQTRLLSLARVDVRATTCDGKRDARDIPSTPTSPCSWHSVDRTDTGSLRTRPPRPGRPTDPKLLRGQRSFASFAPHPRVKPAAALRRRTCTPKPTRQARTSPRWHPLPPLVFLVACVHPYPLSDFRPFPRRRPRTNCATPCRAPALGGHARTCSAVIQLIASRTTPTRNQVAFLNTSVLLATLPKRLVTTGAARCCALPSCAATHTRRLRRLDGRRTRNCNRQSEQPEPKMRAHDLLSESKCPVLERIRSST